MACSRRHHHHRREPLPLLLLAGDLELLQDMADMTMIMTRRQDSVAQGLVRDLGSRRSRRQSVEPPAQPPLLPAAIAAAMTPMRRQGSSEEVVRHLGDIMVALHQPRVPPCLLPVGRDLE